MPPISTKEPLDYEPVLPLSREHDRRGFEDEGEESFRQTADADWAEAPGEAVRTKARVKDSDAVAPSSKTGARAVLRRAHGLTYAGLMLFTFVLFYRPYE